MNNQTDKDKVRRRFGEIFGNTDIDNHPLYQSLIKDLGSSRSLQSIMADLDEAARHQKTSASPQALGWRNESLSA